MFKSQISLSHLCLFGIIVFPVVGLLCYLHFSQERWRAIWIWCAAKADLNAHRIKTELTRMGNIKPFNRYESSSGAAFSQHTVLGKLGSTEAFKRFFSLRLLSTARLMLQLPTSSLQISDVLGSPCPRCNVRTRPVTTEPRAWGWCCCSWRQGGKEAASMVLRLPWSLCKRPRLPSAGL